MNRLPFFVLYSYQLHVNIKSIFYEEIATYTVILKTFKTMKTAI